MSQHDERIAGQGAAGLWRSRVAGALLFAWIGIPGMIPNAWGQNAATQAVAAVASNPAPAAQEALAFDAAGRAFEDGFFERADRELGEFADRFPASERIPQALLLRAQAQCRLGQYDAAVSLLQTNRSRAGKEGDQFVFWMGEARFRGGDYEAAAGHYGELSREFPDSLLRASSSYGEALARFRLGQTTHAIDLLRRPDGVFQQIARAQPEDESVGRGLLLLAEAWLARENPLEAAAVLIELEGRTLAPPLEWQRQYLKVRTQMAAGQGEMAVASLSNLVARAVALGTPEARARTVALQGEVYRAVGQREQAIRVYEEGLTDLEGEEKRQVWLALIELFHAAANREKTAENLELFLANNPRDREVDRLHLLLGELYFQDHQSPSSLAPTNAAELALWRASRLRQALTNFNEVITNFPASPILGRAFLGRGGCLAESGQTSASLADFKEAVGRLPASTNQAWARLKVADAHYQLGDRTNAQANYRLWWEQYGSWTNLPAGMSEQVLGLWARASAELGGVAEADQALGFLRDRFPRSPATERALFEVGQALRGRGWHGESRQRLEELLERFPQSDWRAEARLLVAQSHVSERRWGDALRLYDEWIGAFTNHAALAQVEFDRAWAYDQAGRAAEAMSLFTNFVVRFPRDPRAPGAQYWVGNYYFNRGEYVDAEKQYQLLYQNTNWPVGELHYRGRMAEGRAAYARQGFPDALKDFTLLINLLVNDTNRPAGLLSEAYMALGDTMVSLPSTEPANPLAKFGEAINAYSQVPEADPQAPRAWGLIANCHLQLASQDPARYAQAMTNYGRIIAWPGADIAVRSQAEVGLGKLAERQAAARPAGEQAPFLGQALDHYLNVIEGKNLRAGERPDAFWTWKAGQDAALLLRSQSRWSELARVYERLARLLPGMRPVIEPRLEEARQRLR